ncbi:MAG: dienelactone hydrolase family protein [Clostridia bacterium]|nr:dienelactone hydrolase family protein [Clostridia bacterium]
MKTEVLRYKELDYSIRYPEGFSETEKYPLVIYLHGAGGRGRDINVIKNHSFFADSEQYCKDAVTVVPQCYANTWFDIFEQLKDYVVAMSRMACVDTDRVYVIGASMGGYTTWQIGMSLPEIVAAIVPICGGGMYWNAERLKHTGVWAFHGSADKTVSCEESEKMVAAVNKRGGNAKLTVYEGVPHNSWTPTFQSKEMWAWLFSNRLHYATTKNEYNDVVRFG